MNSLQQRTIISWAIKFFLLSGQIIAHTLVLALTIQNFGISYVPLLFLATGALTLVGTILVRSIPHHIAKEYSILLYSTLLIGALGYIIGNTHAGSLIVGLVFSTALLQNPLITLVGFYIEERFSPLEAKTQLPSVESAEGYSMVAAGLAMILALIGGISTSGLLWVTVTTQIICIGLCVYWFRTTKNLPSLHHFVKEAEHQTKTITYSWTLNIMVFAIFLLLPLSELYFTSTFVSIFGERSIRILTGFALFLCVTGLTTIVIQSFVARKLCQKAGAINTILTTPMLTGVATIASLVIPGLFSAVVVRMLYESFLPVLRLGIGNTLYALPLKDRLNHKSFIEGIIVPSAIAIASGAVLIVEHSIHGHSLWFLLACTMILISFIACMIYPRLRTRYTNYIISNLNKSDIHHKTNLLQILAEPGHDSAIPSLHRLLKLPHEQSNIQENTLHTLGLLHHPQSIPVILQYFQHPNTELRLKCLRALLHYDWQKDNVLQNGFSRHYIVELIHATFAQELDLRVKKTMVRLLLALDHQHTISFLVSALQTEPVSLRPYIIRTIGSFRDPSIHYFLAPYLEDTDPWVQTFTICALWQFDSYRLELLVRIAKLFHAKDKEATLAGTFLIGEIQSFQEKRLLEQRVGTEDIALHFEAGIALIKLNDLSQLRALVTMIINDPQLYDRAEDHLSNYRPQFLKLKQALHKVASEHIRHQIAKLVEGDQATHTVLERLYSLVNAQEELQYLRSMRATLIVG